VFESERLSRLHRDYLASFLRSQLSTLQNVLSSVENSDRYDEEYVLGINQTHRTGYEKF